jgi:2-amino-4-hydroxy-6-hydroxymethyldihydropteridine diphosphokinase
LKTRRVFLGLGSNLGDRAGRLRAARDAIAADPDCAVLRASGELNNAALLYETQPDFLNQILEIETSLTPHVLLARMKALEVRLGRTQNFRYGPREIDIDLLSYNGLVLDDAALTLPHPGLKDRPYLAQLLAELNESPESLGIESARPARAANDAGSADFRRP